MKDALLWLWHHLFEIFIVGLIIVNLKWVLKTFVVQPIQGPDNNTSMPELAQYILILVLIYMIYLEGTNPDIEVFGYEKFAVIAGAVATIASVTVYKKKKDEGKSE